MQRSFSHIIQSIEFKISDFEISFRKKKCFKRRSKNQKNYFSEGHNFLCEKNWALRFMQENFPQPVLPIETKKKNRFGRVVFEKSQYD